jgi:hypothetical protein
VRFPFKFRYVRLFFRKFGSVRRFVSTYKKLLSLNPTVGITRFLRVLHFPDYFELLLVKLSIVRLKSLLALTALGMCVSAHAITVQFFSLGTYEYTGAPAVTATETVLFENAPGAVTTAQMLFDIFADTNGGVYLEGIAIFSDGAADSLTVNFITTGNSYGPGSGSYAGTWEYVSGTGVFENMTGGGTMTAIYDSNMVSTHTFVGDLQAVPEPATMAVLGLGAAALVRRRRTR